MESISLRSDEAVFAELVEEHQKEVYALAYRITGNSDVAWDVAQETFLRAFRKREALQSIRNVRGWLLRIGSNLAIDHMRRQKRIVQPTEEFWDMQLSDRPLASDGVREDETMTHIRATLLNLSERERSAFLLKHWEGLKIAEVADVMDCREGTVKVLIHRAVRKLKTRLIGKI